MYPVTPIYSNKSFNKNNLPSCMYMMKPYYSNVFTSEDQPVPKKLFEETDLDLNDPNTCKVLEDILSRQMLLLCRINELQRILSDSNEVQGSDQFAKLENLKPLTEKHEDICVHFDIEFPPLILLAVLKYLKKQLTTLLVNYHMHSSLINDNELLSNKKQKLAEKLAMINFEFSTVSDNTERGNQKMIITFIAKNNVEKKCSALFKASEPALVGELNILKNLHSLLGELDCQSVEFWQQLTQHDLQSDEVIVTHFSKYFVQLNENTFLFDNKQPTLLDVVLWSLANLSEYNCRALRSLLDPKWAKTIERLIHG